nr:ferredoxin--NADP reductase-like [Nerophis lumbriciformis]
MANAHIEAQGYLAILAAVAGLAWYYQATGGLDHPPSRPCGLFQVFELGLLDIKAHVVDSLPNVGGQCSELYPEKPIYDIPAYPVIGAQELVENLLVQIEPFAAELHLGHEVREVAAVDDRFRLVTSAGIEFDTATVIVAGGVGSFQPRRLRQSGAAKYEASQVHYKITDASEFEGKDVVISGGGDSALDWTLELVERAKSLTLIHRRDDYRAAPASVGKMKELVAAGKMREVQGNIAALHELGDRLVSLDVVNRARASTNVPFDHILAFWGLAPKLGPIAQWGLGLQRNQIEVDTEKFETNIPGIHAVGDINTYPGKKKLILSGFHEAALAAFAIRSRLHPEEKVRLQYTTTSTAMHERLGLNDEEGQ